MPGRPRSRAARPREVWRQMPQVVGDRYELQRSIGSGGMARVYLGVDHLLGRQVAIKVLHEDAAADPAFVERFRREARAAAALNHPNIVAIYDWGQQTESPDAHPLYFMVMEYVPGPNLKEVLREHGPLPEVQALDIAAQTASALQAAHEHGIIHRDVKPHNVLIDPTGRVKVTDFGIARAAGLSQLTRTNIVSGTAHYLSPEQAQRHQLDGRSDLYSLGVVLFEMLAAREPFRGDSLVEVALQHVHAPPPPLREVRPDVSPMTEAVISKALAKDPAERYQSARQMHDALNEARVKLLDASVKRVEETAPARIVEANLTDPTTPLERTEVAPNTPAVRPAARITSPWSTNRWLLAAPLALLILLLAGVSLMTRPGFLFGSGHHTASRKNHPVAVVRPTSTATPTATPTSTPTPQRVPTQPPAVGAQPTPTPTPLPRPTAAPAPTATSTPTATSPPPTAVVASTQGGSGPRNTVLAFYNLVNTGQYDQAAALWTPRMQAAYPPTQNINQRFAGSQITVQSAQVVSRGNDRAAVVVTLQEVKGNGSTQTLNGTWYLVRTAGGWMLDSVAFS